MENKAIGKFENSQLARRQVIEDSLAIVIGNGFGKRDKNRVCNFVLVRKARVAKVNVHIVGRATTTSIQKSIPLETYSENAASLVTFSLAALCIIFYLTTD